MKHDPPGAESKREKVSYIPTSSFNHLLNKFLIDHFVGLFNFWVVFNVTISITSLCCHCYLAFMMCIISLSDAVTGARRS